MLRVIKENRTNFWVYLKYQLVTKLVLSAIILPIYSFILNFLIASSGRDNLSSGDFLSFVFSPQGVGMLFLTLFLFVAIVGIDVNSLIALSAIQGKDGHYVKSTQLLKIGLQSVKTLLNPSGLLVAFYLTILVPIASVGLGITSIGNIKIPNFITSVIYSTPLYLGLYLVALSIIFLLTLFHIFTFHYITLTGDNIFESLKKARHLFLKHWKATLKAMAKFVAFLFVLSLLAVIVVGAGIALLSALETVNTGIYRFFNWLLLLVTTVVVSMVSSVTLPFFIHSLTTLFFQFNKEDGQTVILTPLMAKLIKNSEEPVMLGRFQKYAFKAFMGVMTILILLVSLMFTLFFNDIFRINPHIDVIAHRGGGDLGVENSIEGIESAIAEGVEWTEIDVQRTKDGYYILNHDSSFNRIAGVDKAPMELTLQEIKALDLINEFEDDAPTAKVPTLEELIATSKDNIGLFIELKGDSADYQMVDDVVKQIKDNHLGDKAVILSLDYDIIEYTEKNYPEIETGYLYFFNIGNLKDLKGDYLIMEEGEATDDNVATIKETGKKVIVWTVNTPESIDEFVTSDVDGIITDHVKPVKKALEDRSQKSDVEIILHELGLF
ncbi:glycerophosphodiester phosphodiesterase family protein [Streptococcus pacificus]|uniref:Glycerophosphoryl diester phosphodiesterase membrane domain-containing protein n=1 Tax=Streptococcus pacificus TaxID=2740577 RepID=A0ABS0ZKD1_9STRE|nr:glycerophosphodiester phosphodiesterase family protein [Streptococcus pacificus]MBJ8326480.1 glycerophosphoryl diester phosphodiesterase membrane domain-containing protein [Streptococcus pacificus]